MLKENNLITIKHYNSICEEAKYIRTEVFMKEQGFKNVEHLYNAHVLSFCIINV